MSLEFPLLRGYLQLNHLDKKWTSSNDSLWVIKPIVSSDSDTTPTTTGSFLSNMVVCLFVFRLVKLYLLYKDVAVNIRIAGKTVSVDVGDSNKPPSSSFNFLGSSSSLCQLNASSAVLSRLLMTSIELSTCPPLSKRFCIKTAVIISSCLRWAILMPALLEKPPQQQHIFPPYLQVLVILTASWGVVGQTYDWLVFPFLLQ